MAIRNKIFTVLNLAQSQITGLYRDSNLTRAETLQYQQILDIVCDALDDIQTDNSLQYVIYTGIRATHKFKNIIWEGSEFCDDCDEPLDHPSHTE